MKNHCVGLRPAPPLAEASVTPASNSTVSICKKKTEAQLDINAAIAGHTAHLPLIKYHAMALHVRVVPGMQGSVTRVEQHKFHRRDAEKHKSGNGLSYKVSHSTVRMPVQSDQLSTTV